MATKKEIETLEKQVKADAEFRENVQFYEKETLAFLLCDMAPTPSERQRVIQNLYLLQELGYMINQGAEPETKPLVLAKISELAGRLSEKEMKDLQSVEEAAEMIFDMGKDATLEANIRGNITESMNILLRIASMITWMTAWHLKHNTAGIQQTSPFKDKIKTAPGATEAALTDHQNGNQS